MTEFQDDPIDVNFQIVYFDPRNSLGVAMNLFSFGYGQISQITSIINYSELVYLIESSENGKIPNFELASKFALEKLIDSVRITICFENFMKALLLLNGYVIHRLKRKEFKSISDKQYQEPVLRSEVLKGRKWETNSDIKTDHENLKLQIKGILKTTIGMKELKQPMYQSVFKIDKKIMEICEPYFEYRNNVHLHLSGDLSFNNSTLEDIQLLVKFINDHLVRMHNNIIDQINKGEEYKLEPISLNGMKRLSVEHYLRVYEGRKKMQESGITQPNNEIVKFTAEFVEILNNLPLEQELEIRDHSFYDSRGKLIATIPKA